MIVGMLTSTNTSLSSVKFSHLALEGSSINTIAIKWHSCLGVVWRRPIGPILPWTHRLSLKSMKNSTHISRNTKYFPLRSWVTRSKAESTPKIWRYIPWFGINFMTLPGTITSKERQKKKTRESSETSRRKLRRSWYKLSCHVDYIIKIITSPILVIQTMKAQTSKKSYSRPCIAQQPRLTVYSNP